jgi:hypothetical protein
VIAGFLNHARNHSERGNSEYAYQCEVIIDNQDKGSPPLIADLKGKQPHIIRVELARCEP